MFRKRVPGELDRYDHDSGSRMIDSLAASTGMSFEQAFKEMSVRYTPNFSAWTDSDLAEFIARNRQIGDTELARSEMRVRESWRTPAKPALVVSIVALLISLAAFANSSL